MTARKKVDELTTEQRLVLEQLDDVWVYFHQIPPILPRKRMAAVLRGLSRRGLVVTRRNDVPGQGRHTEYAIDAEADRVINGVTE